MSGGLQRALRVAGWVTLGIGGLLIVRRPAWAPAAVFVCLATASWPLARAWRGGRGTALRWAIPWAGLAIAQGMVGQIRALQPRREFASSTAAGWIFLSALAALAATIAILNARRPGAGAWAFLIGTLMLILACIPNLDGSPLADWPDGEGWSRPRLDNPFTLFFLLLMFVGLTNYAFTRYWLPAGLLGVAIWLGVFPVAEPGEFASPWLLALAAWMAEAQSTRREPAASGLDRLWLWFRDHWGVVWALRVQERFNRAAQAAGWPIRLGWSGAEPVEGGGPAAIPEGAEATLKALLRRFADADRLDTAASGGC